MTYTPAEIYNLARTAASKSRFMMTAGDMDYRVDVAWSAIVEEIFFSETDPDPAHLIYIGTSEIDREVKQVRRNSGQDTSGRLEWAPMFWRYWEPVPRSGPEHAVVDRVTLHQIWQVLPEIQKRVVEAASLFESREKAAASLGMKTTTFSGHLIRARKMFFELWHEGETPSGLWRVALNGKRRDACPRGHALAGDNVAWTGPATRRRRTCRTCRRVAQQRYKERKAAA